MAVWLMQLLCPARHAICAVPYDPATTPRSCVEVVVADEMQAQGINPWCGICGSRDLHAEYGETPSATLEEALPHLQVTEAANLETRARIGQRY